MQNQSTVERVEGKRTGISQWGGLSLLLLGGALFLLSVLQVSLDNWWALFILMPALVLFGIGRAIPRGENGRFSLPSRLFFASGLVVLVVAVMFLLNLDWSVWWPLMIVAPGAALMVVGGKSGDSPTAVAWIGYLRWVAVSIIGLGSIFLAHTLGIIDLDAFAQFHWWGIFIAFSAMGALLQAVRLYGRLGTASLSVMALLSIAVFSGGTAVIELFAIPWSSFYGITAVFFIGSGVILLLNGLRRTSE